MIWIIIGSVTFALICGILGFEYYVYRKVFYSPHKGQNSEYNITKMKGSEDLVERATQLVNELLTIPSEDLWTTSFDNLKLHAYFYRNKDSKEYVVYFHGYRRTARRSFAGRTMELINAKKNVILVDERAHGLSEGHTLTYGKKEQYDVLSWVDYLKKEFGEDIKITLIGISMGATAILGVADKLDKNIKIIADSPYISLKNVLKIALSKVYNNHFFGYPLIAFACLLYCRMSTKYEITENIHNSKNKILIIYGTADHLVPYSVIEGVFLQNKNHVTLEVFDGVGHGIGYNRAPERYLKVMFDFINN